MAKKKPARNTTPVTEDMRQEIASVDRDITQVLFYGGGDVKLLFNADETLRTRGHGKGLLIYDEIERDAHAGAVLDKRKRAVTSRAWDLTPASDSDQDKAIAAQVMLWLKQLQFNKLCKNLLDATLKGFAVVELMWDVQGGFIVPMLAIARDQRRFTFDWQRNLRLLTREQLILGVPLPDRKFIVHSYGDKDGSPYGRGIGTKMFWPAFFKRQDLSFWLIFNEKFGSPTAVGKYPAGTKTDQQKLLLEAMLAISSQAGIVIPAGMEATLLEATRSGSIDAYDRLVRYLDEQLSLAALGETLTTTAQATGLGSGQANVHNEVRKEVATEDWELLHPTLQNTIIKWCVELNWPGAGLPTLSRDFGEPEDLKARADRDQVLYNMGADFTPQYILETYGDGIIWPPRAERAPPISNQVPPNFEAQFAEEHDHAFAAARRMPGWLANLWRIITFAEPSISDVKTAKRQDQLHIVDAAQAAADDYKTYMSKRVDELLAIADDTKDLVMFRERLDSLLNAPPPPEVVEKLQRAGFGAQLLARLPKR